MPKQEEIRPYIRGWRQVTAVYYALWSLFTGNWAGLKRELHIITGFAKLYSIRFAPSFWESAKDNLGWTDDEIQAFKDDARQHFGEDSV